MKNVLFLAPGYKYAETVIKNLSSELDRKKIPHNSSKASNNMYIRTDKVSVEIVYMDPVKWTSNLFHKRDAVYGKKTLVNTAKERFSHMIVNTHGVSLSKYIKDIHEEEASSDFKPRTTYLPEITKVHFNPPMTIVLWDDGTKTMVKCQEGDTYSEEVGLSLCITKKALGNMPNFNNIFRKWVPEKTTNTIPVDILENTSAISRRFARELNTLRRFFE